MAWKTLSQTCPHRNVSDDGRIICKMIGVGDNEVIPLLCRDCPMQAISCDHLRCSLQKIAPTPITVRYVTGRVEILDNEPAQVTFLRAACVKRVMPVNSPVKCAGCGLHSAHTKMPAAVRERAAMHQGEGRPVSQPALVG